MKKQLISVCGFLTDDNNRLLIAKRSDSEAFMPGLWELVGGGVEYGEDPYDALKREFKEELSIEIKIIEPYFTFCYLNEENQESSHEVEIDFFVKQADANQTITIDISTHSDCKWISESEIGAHFREAPVHAASQLNAVLRGFQLLADA